MLKYHINMQAKTKKKKYNYKEKKRGIIENMIRIEYIQMNQILVLTNPKKLIYQT